MAITSLIYDISLLS